VLARAPDVSDKMKRSKALAVTVRTCLALLGLGSAAHATDVVWKDVTYHDASITAVNGDQVEISGTRDSDGAAVKFKMPVSVVPDEVIHAYRAARKRSEETAEKPPTAKEEAAIKEELAARDKKLAILKDMLANDPFHPVIVAGHIVLKNADGVVIFCDAANPANLPQTEGTVFLRDCPGAQSRSIGDPIAAVGYAAGEYVYNFQKIKAFSVATRSKPAGKPAPSIGPTPASSR
jgi:hypothetical protein